MSRARWRRKGETFAWSGRASLSGRRERRGARDAAIRDGHHSRPRHFRRQRRWPLGGVIRFEKPGREPSAAPAVPLSAGADISARTRRSHVCVSRFPRLVYLRFSQSFWHMSIRVSSGSTDGHVEGKRNGDSTVCSPRLHAHVYKYDSLAPLAPEHELQRTESHNAPAPAPPPAVFDHPPPTGHSRWFSFPHTPPPHV